MPENKKIKLDSIGPEEDIIKIVHRSWFDISSQYFMVLGVMALLALTFSLYLFKFEELKESSYRIFFVFLANLSVLAVWIYCFLIWIDYYFDIWVITTEKIINIEQKSLFVRRVTEAKYDKIQDVTVEVKGILQTIINFGDVLVQTAGENENIQFRKVSDPHEIKNIIVKMQKDRESRRTHDIEEAIVEGLAEK